MSIGNKQTYLELSAMEGVTPIEDIEILEFLNIIAKITARIMVDRMLKEYTNSEN